MSLSSSDEDEGSEILESEVVDQDVNVPSSDDSCREAMVKEIVEEGEREMDVDDAVDLVPTSGGGLDSLEVICLDAGFLFCEWLVVAGLRGMKKSLAAIDCLCLKSCWVATASLYVRSQLIWKSTSP